MLTKKQLLDASKCDIHYCKTCGMLPLCENMYDPDNTTRELAKTALAYRETLEQAEKVLKSITRCPYCWGKETHSDKCEINKTITEIDKVLGGKDDGKTDI